MTPATPSATAAVDINDLTIVLTNYGQTGCAWSQGGMDGDPTGTVDVNDLTIVLANFGTTYGSVTLPPCQSPPPLCSWPRCRRPCRLYLSAAKIGQPIRRNQRRKGHPVGWPFAFLLAPNTAVRGQPACWVGVRSSGRSAYPYA